MAERARWEGNRGPAVAIAIVTFLAFLPALQAGFVTWDDNRNFTGNPAFRGLGVEQLKWMWTTTLMGHYIPVSWMTLGLDYSLWGMDGRGYHLTNLLLHCAAAVLLYFVALRLFEAGAPELDAAVLRIPVAAAVLAWAVHPLRVESVAWITERRDVLSMVFYLAAILLYLRGSNRWALAAFAIALLSKATAVTLPAVLLVINVYPLRRLDLSRPGSAEARSVYRELAPFAALALAAGLVSLNVLHPPAQLGLAQKVAVTAYSIQLYLLKTILPIGLSPLYEMPRPVLPGASKYWIGYALTAAIIAVTWALRRKQPAVAATVVASALIIFPLLGIVQNGPQIAADRYTYHAAAALSLLVALMLIRWPSRALAAATAAGILALAALTWRQTTYWKDSEHLWVRVLEVDSTSSIAQIAMADLRLAQGRPDEAMTYYERGVALDSTYAEGHNNLGSLLARQGRFADAIRHYETAVSLKPTYAESHLNWGVALSGLGDHAKAIEHFEKALALAPDLANVHQSWGNALLRAGRRQEAIAQYVEEVRLHPSNAQAHLNWGAALAQQNDLAGARDHFNEALRLNPSLDDARKYLGQLERANNVPRATRHDNPKDH